MDVSKFPDFIVVIRDILICECVFIEDLFERVHVVSKYLNDFMDSAVKHYSSLFKLPTYSTMLLVLALLCVATGALSTLISFSFPTGLLWGLLLGVSLFFCDRDFRPFYQHIDFER